MSEGNHPPGESEVWRALIGSKLDEVKEDIKEIKDAMKTHYVTADQFEPVRLVVYGIVGVILMSVMGAVLALVIIRR